MTRWFLAQALMLGAAAAVPAQEAANDAAKEPKAEPAWPGMTRAGTVLLPNGWSLDPAGSVSLLGDFPVLMAEHPEDPVVAVQHAGYGDHEVRLVSARDGKALGSVVVPTTFTGMCWAPDGKALFVSGGFDDVVHRYAYADGALGGHEVLDYAEPSRRVPGGMAAGDDGKSLWVAHVFGHSVGRFDLESGKQRGEIPLPDDSYPYGVAWDKARDRLYVSLWGQAKVAVIDAGEGKIVATWATEEHPNELLISRDGKVLFVANANRNTVSVFDLDAGKALETIGTAIAPDAPAGCTPSSLSLSADGKVLFVANANTNDVAAVNVEVPGASKPLGFIPVGWYPTAVRVARDGKTLLVANGKGASSKANRDGPNPLAGRGGADPTREYIGRLFKGTLSRIPFPSPSEMEGYTKRVYACSPLKADKTGRAANSPIPAKPGDPSPIKHCIYIVKENRTYDQVFGDMPEGNGEPALCLFPEEVTPNHHALAREFVLLDNFYVDAEVSADGHEWSMGAYATDFVEKLWPLSYRGDRRVPYPAEAAFLSMATPAGGYLWDRAKAKGVSYRSYGEFVRNGRTPAEPATTGVPALRGHFDPKYRSYDLNYPDVKRAARFLEELAEFEREGEMPRLIIMRLPNDHTAGTRPGAPTVRAMVADNDLALGMVVEGLSKSRFWKELAIFVIEDDAQNGSDHVDAHRTVALAISPYIKRKSVDSTLYSTSSILRTMELILGLDPMSQFDAAATPMHAAFAAEPDPAPYAHRPARIPLDAVNTADAWGAEASTKLNLAQEDQADDLIFNEIIWKAVRGADSPMPPPVRAAFVRPKVDDDDDDDEEEEEEGGE